MKQTFFILVAALVALGAAPAPEPETGAVLAYDVAAVKRHLLLTTANGELPLQKGDQARSGDSLRTGSRSTADLEVPEFAARFHIVAKTRFQLTGNQPGVLINVERGSLRGVFGKLPDGDNRERLVTTPSAVLAVRGTEYGIKVEKDGDTTLMVFEGIVEVRDPRGIEEVVRVHAGQSSRLRKGRAPGAPAAHGMSAGDWDRGRRSMKSTQGSGQPAPGMGNGAQQGGSGQSKSSQGGSKRHGG